MSRLSRHHFPERIPIKTLSDVGAGTLYPFGFPLATIYKWAFLVKRWELTSDAAGSATGDADSASASFSSIPNREVAAQISIGDPVFVSDESQLTLQCPFFIGSDSYAENYPTASAGVEYFFQLFANILPDPIWRVGDLYYPQMVVGINVSAGGLTSSGGGGIAGASVILTASAPGTSSQDVNFDGHILEMPVTIDSIPYPGASASASISTVSILPVEYWPHADASGPAYDSVTGAYLL